MIHIDFEVTPQLLFSTIQRLFTLSADKIRHLQTRWNPEKGTPIFTIKGEYTSRGWTEWTQGFQFGSAIYQYEVTRDPVFLDLGRRNTVDLMAPHVTHGGVHDHGFNNVSTYGNLLRLMADRMIPYNPWEKNFYELALKASGAVQAARWERSSTQTSVTSTRSTGHTRFSLTRFAPCARWR